jgi:hypothetical protein
MTPQQSPRSPAAIDLADNHTTIAGGLHMAALGGTWLTRLFLARCVVAMMINGKGRNEFCDESVSSPGCEALLALDQQVGADRELSRAVQFQPALLEAAGRTDARRPDLQWRRARKSSRLYGMAFSWMPADGPKYRWQLRCLAIQLQNAQA